MSFSSNNEIIAGFDDEKDDTLRIILERCASDAKCIKVHLANRIDNYNTAYFQRAVDKIILAGFSQLMFCCSSLNYVSSTGIGAFTSILKDLRLRGGGMVLAHVHPRVYEIFELLGFTTFFTFSNDEDTAYADFLHSAAPSSPKTSGASVFPLAFRCPTCSIRLKTSKPGKFRCSACQTKIVVDGAGRVRAWREVSG